MKKCPFCAEEILDKAIVCKYCKSSLVSSTQPPQISPGSKQSFKAKARDIKILKILGIIVLIPISIWLWYLAIPALAVWFIWKKSKKLNKTKKIIFTAVIAVLSIVMWITLANISAPKLTILEPKGDMDIQADSIEIKGTAKPASAVVRINNKIIKKDGEFNFTYKFPLSNEKNTVVIEATNDEKVMTKTLVINRILTEAERAEMEAKKQAEIDAQKKAEEARIAKEKAEQKAWDNSKAGQLCAKHPGWTKDDCQNIVDHKIWIGMDLDMLKAERGTPSSANPSNYGGGTEWQWCWWNYTPSCFYGGSDGIITSYN